MKSYIKLMSVCAMGGVLAGCAFTNETLPLNYQLKSDSVGILKTGKQETITVRVKDNRDVDNPRLIIHKQNADNNVTSGEYLAEKPIADIVKDGLSSGLKQMGYRVMNRGKYGFNCELLSVKSESIMGFFQGTIGFEIQLNVRVYNESTQASVWQNIIIGHGSEKTGWADRSIFSRAFNKALTNAVRQIQTSRSLVKALEG